MKTKLLLCLALVLSGGLFGCSTNPSAARTKVFNYSIPDSGDVVALKGLGKSLSVRVEADSWQALIEKTKPTFAWNGRDMMWIESNANGQPQFVLDEAYIYQPMNQPLRWVLLDTQDAPFDEWYGEVMGNNLRGVATLHQTVPIADNDAGIIGDYAMIKSTHPRFGKVYEIGWQKLMANGTCLCEDNRRLYVWKDQTKHWHFLGEGPGEESERGGGQTVESKVVWENSPTNDLPFQIRFHREETTSPYNNSADNTDTNNPESVTICYDSVLVAELPAQHQKIGHNPYLLTETNDTLEKIIFRLGYFEPGWDSYPDEAMQQAKKKQILEAWRVAVTRLNPELSLHGKINAGSRVEIVNPGEMANQLIEMDRQSNAAEKIK